MPQENRVWTVTEVNNYIKGVFSEDFILSDISVKGELSNVKYHTSGHIYFTLKDGGSEISAVMFRSYASGLRMRLEAGDSVIVGGEVSVYEKKGSYSIRVKSVRAAGIGDLYRRFLELKERLQDRGLFAEMYKKPIPAYISKLGVVTASTGAAIQDIIKITRRRNPFVEIVFYSAKVQGEGAAESIADGINALQAERPDVIIVGRGGGSIEDLWAFNEETVAEAIFNSSIPVISGTGHETDVTIADLVADLRAPTPSAAAELAVFELRAFDEDLEERRLRLISLMEGKILRYRENASELKARLEGRSPTARLRLQREKTIRYEKSIVSSMERILTLYRNRAAMYAEKLSSRSPLHTLSRGYTYTENAAGEPVRSIEDVSPGELVTIYTTDGKIGATVNGKHKISY